MLILIGGIIGGLFLLTLIALQFYVVVEPNKAHVVVSMGGGRRIYHPSDKGTRSAYFYIPFLMRRIIVSLENVKHEINNIILHDSEVAPFQCDITCWFKITDPQLAGEKLDVDSDGNIMDSIRETLNAQVQGVARDAAMKQEVLELMRDRKTFGEGVFATVNGDLDEWGVQLVKLEIIDFSDTQNSHIIRDYEARREATISSTTRQTVALQDQEAKVKEAEAKRISERARIESEQEVEMRAIEARELMGVRSEKARLNVAVQSDLANAKEVTAQKTKILGEANYTAEASVIRADGEAKSKVKASEGQAQAEVKLAEGRASAVKVEAVAAAESTEKRGAATAKVVELTGAAEAAAVEKKADAQKKFTDASKEIELSKIAADIEKTKYLSMANAMQKANIQVISPDMSFMGFGAKEGAGLGVLVESLTKASGLDLKGILSNLGKKEEPAKA